MASSNTLLTPTIIAKEALMMLVNNMAMSRNVHTAYKNEFVKVGTTISVRKPNKFRATKAQARSNSDLVEPSTSITMSTQAHVSWAFSSVELTTTIEDYSKRYIAPAAAALANVVDYDLCGLFADIANSVGEPGVTPSTFKSLADAQELLDNECVPSDRRVCVVEPGAHWALADGLKGTFAQNVAKDIITKGYLGTIANLSIYMDQNIRRHTNGAFEDDITVNDVAIASGDASLITAGWGGSSTVKAGDVFTIADNYACNPMSGASTGKLRQYVVTTNTADDGAAMTIPLAPAFVYGSTNAYSNVTALPVTGKAITFKGTASTEYPQNLVFHPNAFALVTVPIEIPANVWGARETDPDAGLSIRVVKQYSIADDEEVIRLDILYGVKTLYREMAVRLWG